jgi:UDP-glucose 4-epimerase
VALLEHPEARGKVFNVGSQEEVSIKALAERVIDLTGSASKIRLIPYGEAYSEGFEDMFRRVPDLTRINRLVGYSPKYRLDDILDDVIQEMRAKTGR